MILFTILAIIFVLLIVSAILILSIGGSAFIIVFADVIVCAVIVGLIIKKLLR